MNILQGMTWPLGTELGGDHNEIYMRFDKHCIREGDHITYNLYNGYSFYVTKVNGDWVTCKRVTYEKGSILPSEIPCAIKFLTISYNPF